MRRRSTSIAIIVILIIVVSTFVVLGIAGGIAYSALYTQEVSELNTLTEVLVEQARTACTTPLWNLDKGEITEAVRSVMQIQQVYAVVVRQPRTGEIIIALARNDNADIVELGSRTIPPSMLTRESDISHGKEIIGSVQVFVTPGFLEKRLATIRLFIFVSIAIVAAILSFILYVLLWRIVLKPVRLLEEFSRHVNINNAGSESILSLSFKGELESLRVSILGMVELLESRYLALMEKSEELSQSEAFRKRVYESSRVPIIIMDAVTFQYIDCNNAAVEIYKFGSKEDVIGKTPLDFSAPIQYDGTPSEEKSRFFINKTSEERSVVFEWRHKLPDGKEWDAEVHLMSFIVDNRRLLQFILQDITVRKQAVAALQLSEEKFARAFRSSPDIIVISRLSDGQIIEVNDRAEKILGYQREELIGKSTITLGIWTDLVQRDEYISKLKSDGCIYEHDVKMQTRTGTVIDILLSGELIELNGEQCILGTLRDITTLKRSEAALRESDERFRQMAENIEEIFFLYQKEGNKLLYMSPVITKIFGVELNTVKADPQIVDRAVHPDDLLRVKFVHREYFYSESLDEEFRIIAPDNSIHWLQLRSFLVHDEQGNVIRVAGLATDITALKKAQEQTRQQQLQLIQADKMASLGLLVSGIAHEINNPNNYISLSAPLLRKAWESLAPCIAECKLQHTDMAIGTIPLPEFMENIGKLMDGIEEGSRKIKRIVTDLKDYARQDTLEMHDVDINVVVRSAINLTMPHIKKKTKHFSVEYAAAPLHINGNLQRLEQVVINLVQNACDALTDDTQSISVRCVARDDKAAIVVADTGSGILPENLAKIVDPFFTTKRESGGTGLGLSVSMGIIKEHHGDMNFESEPGNGTTVTLLFNRK